MCILFASEPSFARTVRVPSAQVGTFVNTATHLPGCGGGIIEPAVTVPPVHMNRASTTVVPGSFEPLDVKFGLCVVLSFGMSIVTAMDFSSALARLSFRQDAV